MTRPDKAAVAAGLIGAVGGLLAVRHRHTLRAAWEVFRPRLNREDYPR